MKSECSSVILSWMMVLATCFLLSCENSTVGVALVPEEEEQTTEDSSANGSNSTPAPAPAPTPEPPATISVGQLAGTWSENGQRFYYFNTSGSVWTDGPSASDRTGNGNYSISGDTVSFTIRWSDGNTSRMTVTISGQTMYMHWTNSVGVSGDSVLNKTSSSW